MFRADFSAATKARKAATTLASPAQPAASGKPNSPAPTHFRKIDHIPRLSLGDLYL
jgi:hypothetical protein